MIRSLRHRANHIAALTLLCMLTLSGTAGAFARHSSSGAATAAVAFHPTLTTDITASAQVPGLFTVAGKHFTPGGRAYLAVYDEMGAKLYENRRVIVSSTIATEIGSGNGPIRKPVPGGTLQESFAGLCGTNTMIRALDEETGVWSNWLNVQANCSLSGFGPY